MTVLQANMFLNNGDTRTPHVFICICNLYLSESMRLPHAPPVYATWEATPTKYYHRHLTGDVIEPAPT
jgi:hypothetical protein